MDLANINLLSLQSTHMQRDPTTIALCEALNPAFQELSNEIKLCLIYSRIDELDSNALNELAWEGHIDWYDASADLEIKRQLVKQALKIHMYRGTPYAIEELIQTLFGDGYVQEWFEYGGSPHMFKVVTSNSSVTAELTDQFVKVLNSVKRKSSHLEQIVISLSGEMNLSFAGVVHTGDFLEIRQVM